MNKPISLVISEVKQKLVVDINTSNLHPSIMVMILKDMYLETEELAKQQFEVDRFNYEKALADEKLKEEQTKDKK